jgi:hypothetical protein
MSPLTLPEIAARLGIHRSTAYRIFAHRKGVLCRRGTGKRPIIRVPVAVVEAWEREGSDGRDEMYWVGVRAKAANLRRRIQG